MVPGKFYELGKQAAGIRDLDCADQDLIICTQYSPPLEGWQKFKEFLTGWSRNNEIS